MTEVPTQHEDPSHMKLYHVLIKGGRGALQYELEHVIYNSYGAIYFDYVESKNNSLTFYTDERMVYYTSDEYFIKRFTEVWNKFHEEKQTNGNPCLVSMDKMEQCQCEYLEKTGNETPKCKHPQGPTYCRKI